MVAAVTPGKRQPWHRLPEKGAELLAMEAFRNMYCAKYLDGEHSPGQWVGISAIIVRSGRHEMFPTELWEVFFSFFFFPLLVSWEAVTGHLLCFPAVAVACSIWQSWNWDTASCWADVCICWYCFWRDGYTKWVVELCLAVSLIPWKLREQWD